MAERAAIVTGASSGIGLALTEMLAQEGYGVTMAARRPDKLAAAAEQLRGAGHDVHEVAGSLADEDVIKRVVAEHRDRYGRLDVLVNNAGVGVGAPVAEIETKRLDMQLEVNIRSTILFYRECVELLRAAGAEHRNALVVNTSSISGKRGQAWLSVYSATKFAVVGWTEAMNKELVHRARAAVRAARGDALDERAAARRQRRRSRGDRRDLCTVRREHRDHVRPRAAVGGRVAR